MSTPPLPDLLDFACPGCGGRYRVPLDRVPDAGVSAPCRNCGRPLRLTRQGLAPLPPAPASVPSNEMAAASPAGPPPAPPPTAPPPRRPTATSPVPAIAATAVAAPSTPPARLWTVRTIDRRTVALPEPELLRRLRQRKVLPWDLASVDGSPFAPVHDLAPFPEAHATFELPPSRNCAQHPSAISTSVCSTCRRGFCAGCAAAIPAVRPGAPALCPACDSFLEAGDPRWGARPFWEELPEVALFAIRDGNWFTTACVGALLWGGRFLLPFTLPLLLLGFAWIVHVISLAGSGKTKLGYGPDFSHVSQLLRRGFQAILVSLAIALPFVILNVWILARLFSELDSGDGWSTLWMVLLNIPLAAVAVAYYPMAIGMVAIWDRAAIAFLPHFVVDHIRKIPFEYLAIVAAFLALGAIRFAFGIAFGFIPLLGGMLNSVVEAWTSLTFSYILGRTLWRNEEKLGWL